MIMIFIVVVKRQLEKKMIKECNEDDTFESQCLIEHGLIESRDNFSIHQQLFIIKGEGIG